MLMKKKKQIIKYNKNILESDEIANCQPVEMEKFVLISKLVVCEHCSISDEFFGLSIKKK